MDGQGSVRRNIALKLKDSSSQKTTDTSRKKREGRKDEAEDSPSAASADKASASQQPTVPVVPTVLVGETMRSQGSGQELKWDHRLNLIGRAMKDPLLHLCEICSLPVLIYGRMKKCRHAFCRDCAKKAAGVCPKCKEGDQIFEEATMGNVYICTHGGGRYDNLGCGRSYLSQRDLEAHISYRHRDKSLLPQAGMLPHGISAAGTSIPSFPLPAFLQAGIPRPDLAMPPHPTGLPPNFPGTLPPPPPPMPPMGTASQAIRLLPPPPMVSLPPFTTQPNPSFKDESYPRSHQLSVTFNFLFAHGESMGMRLDESWECESWLARLTNFCCETTTSTAAIPTNWTGQSIFK